MPVMVAVVKGHEPIAMTVKALEMLNIDMRAFLSGRVLIKPNYIVAKHPSSGVTTDARVIEGVIRFLRRVGVKSITIGEGSGFADTMAAFKVAGVDDVAEREGVGLVDLNKDRFTEIEIPSAVALKRVKIANAVLDSVIVSVPKLKVHSIAGVTLSLKNMMGAITPKGVMHGRLHEKIVDLASIIKPRLAIIDGIVGGAGGELGAIPVKMDLVVAGEDPVAVDSVGAAIMGMDPAGVSHIRLAEKRGLGVGSLEKIKVVGEPIETVRKNFSDLG